MTAAIIALAVLAYAASAIGAGYCTGMLSMERYADREGRTFLACIAGPIGLLVAASLFASQRAERRRELEEAKHAASLKELAAATREVERLLSEPRR